MLRFEKLRLTGFKSFVEGTDLVIDAGLTGVVGPNGCGKSNLVEAVRWVMGESSARQMRGAGMDDVIFAGTQGRPARSVAEVVLTLANPDRTAPPPFDTAETLEIARRIQRGVGSGYRINGREVRARDVQLLFADSATGARSPALVGQGRIGALINARPAERRALLEEAAGIAGLHSRRQEAETRLRGAENNLGRVEDVLHTLEGRVRQMQRQAGQARRYRDLSAQIQATEALLAWRQWHEALADVTAAREAHQAAETALTQATAAATAAATAETEATAALPPLREAQAAAASVQQRLYRDRDRLQAEEAQVRQLVETLRRRQQEAGEDLKREEARTREAEAALTRLVQEASALEAAETAAAGAAPQATARRDAAEAALGAASQHVTDLAAALAADEARQQAQTRHGQELARRAVALAARQAKMAAQRRAVEAETVAPKVLDAAAAAVTTAEQALVEARHAADSAGEARRHATEALEEARQRRQDAAAVVSGLTAEAEGVRAALQPEDSAAGPTLLDHMTVPPGLEAAVGALLGPGATAAVADEGAACRWRPRPPLGTVPPLPPGAEPLAETFPVPAVLARRLALAGLVADAETGAALAARLQPGQVLVDARGGLWAWDGYEQAGDRPDPAAARLKQRNRLAALEQRLAAATVAVTLAEAAVAEAQQARDESRHREQGATAAVQAAEKAGREARAHQAALSRQADQAGARLAALAETESALATEAAAHGRAAEAAAAQARERYGRAEEALAAADRACRTLAQRIAETRHCRPEALPDQAGVDPHAALPDGRTIEQDLARLTAQREALGAVNLRAEEELVDLEDQVGTLGRERDDLTAAIGRLRQGIHALNREGRERLLASFEQVNSRFAVLFQRLFGGGRAHLTLVESEDPLAAGLEIMARPPGKKLQLLSLLSGGEQTLTALALLFAVFQTNPAPVCVLDEVDAPLDDANVDRFCSLLEEMAASMSTRFLLITHHRMTMARVDRLYGVTMAEPGISTLLSVNLTRAEQLREPIQGELLEP